MGTARGNHTATLLLNGKVLVAGGFNRNTSSAVATAELYDPATGTWTPTGSLAAARDYHTATLLLSGKVLVAGGAPDAAGFSSFASAEVYDPNAGTWTTIGSMGSARQAHIATLLPDGKVLAAGGNYNSFNAPTIVALASAELYNPTTGTWSTSESLIAPRSTHAATLLPNGKVLVAAGYYVNNNVQLFSAELYDSAAGNVTLVNPVKLPGGAFQFAFTGAANGTNTLLAATNLALPLANWTVLGVAPEFSTGLFVFSDAQAAGNPQRFYRIRSP
jgi:hypothetical protein